MEAACRSRRRKTRHLGLSCDLHLQTGRALLSLRPRLGPAVSHLLSQIRYRDVPDWRYPQPRVSPVFPGHTCRSIPTDICLRSQTHEKTRWVLDEASSSLSMHSATERWWKFFFAQSGRLYLDGSKSWRYRWRPQFNGIRQKIFPNLKRFTIWCHNWHW